MTTHEHAPIAGRFAALASQPLPEDWRNVLDRAGAGGERRERGRRSLIVAFAVALAVAAVASAAVGAVRIFVLDRGFIGLPPVGATPSTPESGELVLHWGGGSVSHAKRHRPFAETLVYADGRMIWQRDGLTREGWPSGYLEQRLTPEAVEHLRSEVAGLLDRSRALLEIVPDVPEPWGPYGGLTLFVPEAYGGEANGGSVEVREGDGFVRLQWLEGDPRDFESDPRSGWSGTSATPEQLSALRRIDALLPDPTSVLPASAWAVREVRAYVPSHYAVCMSSYTSKDASQLLSLLPARAAELLRDESWTPTYADSYCSKLTTDEAREVADAVSGLARHTRNGGLNLIYEIAGAVTLHPTTIEFNPYLPDGRFLLHGGGR